jgi:hypothetical protein
MRLTKYDKQAFVSSVMQDVPRIDYDEQAQAFITASVVASLPPKVREVYDDPKLRDYLDASWVSTPGYLNSFCCHGGANFEPTPEFSRKLEEFSELKRDQTQARGKLEAKLQAAINSCSTLRQARERLPEFLAYLPKEEEPLKNLPAVANLVVSLIDAGWQQKEAA